ncbi:MmyB family transcriptional regulator [Cupriavidus basilensis]|uniref:MmyB family transcriptional regulator n=1 Tax=Cupriavidus sp. SK-3 TaxID=1470558 RepID=UPI00044A6C1E|nr:helix-turn-helix domain-containing protein [Cupriavidus sp. SK-3]KDP88730.1 XRE family transcriptional regulator [Cupriavidus sp. SK-3]
MIDYDTTAESSGQSAAAPDAASARELTREAVLGRFLRAHRERVAPEQVGLAPGRRRRTPGLRREELAQLSGLSATWVTWLEQGRPVALSARALASLASALRLTRAERAYLFELAGRRDPMQAQDEHVPATVLASVEAIAGPAYLLDRQWNALAWNAAAADLFIGWLDPASAERNLLRSMFLSPGLQALVDDWPHRAARLVAEFRAHSIRHAEDPPTRALVEGLITESQVFRKDWLSQDVEERQGGRRGFRHPRRGLLHFEQLTLVPAAAPGLTLVMLMPARALTEES